MALLGARDESALGGVRDAIAMRVVGEDGGRPGGRRIFVGARPMARDQSPVDPLAVCALFLFDRIQRTRAQPEPTGVLVMQGIGKQAAQVQNRGPAWNDGHANQDRRAADLATVLGQRRIDDQFELPSEHSADPVEDGRQSGRLAEFELGERGADSAAAAAQIADLGADISAGADHADRGFESNAGLATQSLPIHDFTPGNGDRTPIDRDRSVLKCGNPGRATAPGPKP